MRVWNETRGITLGDQIRVADTSVTRRKGLLDCTTLARGEGLWIVPCEAIHTFLMKFPIDVAFLTREREVVKIRHNVGNRRIAFCLRAHSVLELPAGLLRETATSEGDRLRFDRV